MFDNPNQNLKKLQEQLLAAEEPEEDIFAPAREEYQPDDPEEYPGEYPEEYAEEYPEDPEDEADARERQRKTRQSFLLALLLLEVALLFGVLAWWLLW
mgnify:FL=1